MMPTFEPVAMRRIVLNRANKLAANSNFWLPEGWKLIETAPKDCGFLGYQKITPDTWVIAPMYWSGSEWLIIQFHSDNTEHPMTPTHWMPLPAAPKGGEE